MSNLGGFLIGTILGVIGGSMVFRLAATSAAPRPCGRTSSARLAAQGPAHVPPPTQGAALTSSPS
ncbi:hypothetical protein [Streptomyces thioluteus]|uniref:hypothetical protein n=1 Tax=Streptomyces thioluteus TaxID=66431 RepID=UPI0031EC61E2